MLFRSVYFVCRFRSLDTSKLDARRRLIDSFVNAVTIFDDYILITFNYKEGETRIDFADIESSDLQSVGGPRCVDERCNAENAAQKCGVFAYNAPLLE